jgi:predicted DsbA family dithiol-disulfide isomerase
LILQVVPSIELSLLSLFCHVFATWKKSAIKLPSVLCLFCTLGFQRVEAADEGSNQKLHYRQQNGDWSVQQEVYKRTKGVRDQYQTDEACIQMVAQQMATMAVENNTAGCSSGLG